MKVVSQILVIVVLLCGNSNAQPVFNVKNVDVLRLNGNNVGYYAANNMQLREISVDISPAYFANNKLEEKADCKIHYNNTGKFKNVEDLFNKEDKIIPVKDIMPLTTAALLEKINTTKWEWDIPNKPDRDKPPAKKRFTAFNRHLLVLQELHFEKRAGYGFGYYYAKKDDNEKRWRTERVILYSYCIIDLGDNKKILLLFDNRQNNAGYIIPSKKQWLICVNDADTGFSKIKAERTTNEWKANPERLQETLDKCDLINFYHVDSINSNTLALIDNWGEKLLPGNYSQIDINNYFIKTQQNINGQSVINLYNTLLEQLPVKEKIRVVYPYYYYYQVLAGNHLRKIDIKGTVIQKAKINISLTVCGTVDAYSYKLDTAILQDATPFYRIKAKQDGMASINEYQKYTNFPTANTATMQLCFLDGSNELHYDGNTEKQSLPYNWLLVKEQNHWGIKAFNWDKAKNLWDDIKDSLPIDDKYHYKGEPQKILYICKDAEDTLATILPTVYDSIVTPSEYAYSEPLFIYRNGLVGYFPVNKDARYKSFIGRDSNFQRFILPDGNYGWLDINDGKEYLDDKNYAPVLEKK